MRSNGIALGPDSPLRSTSKKLRLGFTESQMQQAAVALLVGDRRTSFGMIEKHPELALLYAIPNQRASKGEAGRMRGEGALDGMPDLCLPRQRVVFGATYGALYTEVKLDGEYPRPNQRRVIDLLRKAGNAVVICRSVEAIIEAQTVWLGRSDPAVLDVLQKYLA